MRRYYLLFYTFIAIEAISKVKKFGVNRFVESPRKEKKRKLCIFEYLLLKMGTFNIK